MAGENGAAHGKRIRVEIRERGQSDGFVAGRRKTGRNGGDSKNKGRKTRLVGSVGWKRKDGGGRKTNYVIYKRRRRNNAWLEAVRSGEAREAFARLAARRIERKMRHKLAARR